MKKHSARFELHSADRAFTVAYTNVAGYNCGYTITTPNGSTIHRIIERDEFRRNLVTNCATCFNSSPVDSNTYAFDALARPTTRRTGTTGVSSVDAHFAYNNRSEVVSAAIGSNLYAHAYDDIGNHVLFSDNLTTNTFTHNALNQMVGRDAPIAPPTTFAYTPDGGLSSDGDWDYAYDAEDRLVSVTSSSLTNGAIRVQNSYDYRHRRISKMVQRLSVTTAPPPSPPVETYEWNTIEYRTFAYDKWNLINETVAAIDGGTTNVSEVQYFWGLDLSDSLQDAGGVGGLLAASSNGQYYFPTYDNNGNVAKYIDESGNVVAAYEYDDFGRVISQSGTLADFFRHRFSTKYYDSETKLCYYGYRFYSPDWRIWLNRDPIGESGGVNLSMFVFNNPMFQFDADGRVVMPITIAPPDFYVPAQGSQTPSLFDQLGSGTGPFHEENWFESNYSGWINTSKSLFIKEINKSIDCKNTQLNIKSSRQVVDPGIAGDTPWKMPVGGNDRLYGDNGQNNWQATLVLGKFAIDYVTPITIQYGTCNNGKRKYSWSTTMYVEDSLGLQGTESWLGKYFGWAAKSRRARRAHWIINGSGTCNCCE